MPSSSPDPTAIATAAARQQAYWRATVRLTLALLLLWFVVTFVGSYFAHELSFTFFGWPFSFWLGAQGALLVFLLIVGVYAWAMNRLDRAHAPPP